MLCTAQTLHIIFSSAAYAASPPLSPVPLPSPPAGNCQQHLGESGEGTEPSCCRTPPPKLPSLGSCGELAQVCNAGGHPPSPPNPGVLSRALGRGMKRASPPCRSVGSQSMRQGGALFPPHTTSGNQGSAWLPNCS